MTRRGGELYEAADDDLRRRADERTGLNKPIRYSRTLGRFLRDDEDFPAADREEADALDGPAGERA